MGLFDLCAASATTARPPTAPFIFRLLRQNNPDLALSHPSPLSLEVSSNQQAAYQVQNEEHSGSFGHEAIAGAASFAAVRAYEQHCAANGQPQNHALALEIIAGFAGAEADKLIETKGLNEVDAIKVSVWLLAAQSTGEGPC